jgi:hypothetical protein
MHSTFSSTVAGWQNFYGLAGAASATLIGLLFVAVSLHIDLIGEPDAAAILSVARRTFGRFILVVIVSLLFLVPNLSRMGLGLPLLALGIVDSIRTLRHARVVIRAPRRSFGSRDGAYGVLFPVVLPLASGVGLIVVAATVLASQTTYLYWMLPIIALVLANAATSAWDLMLGLARFKRRRADKEPPIGVETTGQ